MGVRIRSRATKGDESGATLVIIVLLLFALMGMVVLVVDVGGLLVKKRYMVQAADAAALAAAESCAVGAGTVLGNGQPAGDPETVALTYSRSQGQNPDTTVVPGAGADSGGIIQGPPWTDGCQTSSKGHVTVSYTTQQSLFFAGIFGYGRSSSVGARATASWGPLGGGSAVPIVVDSGTLQGPCLIPGKLGDPPHQCNLWYNNGMMGNGDWGFMNLDEWNVTPTANCNSAGGASARGGYIKNNFPGVLLLNGTPPGTAPTYVCTESGHATSNWTELRSRIGDTLLFPVNDCAGQLAKNGSIAPCTSTPDKYDVIGFVGLVLQDVLKGNDPAAYGVPGVSGSCSVKNAPLAPGSFNLVSYGTAHGCTIPGTPSPIPLSSVRVSPKRGPNYVGCPTNTVGCDYTYDQATGTFTWLKPSPVGATLAFDWTIAAQAGACGVHTSDSNALCLVTQWVSFTTGSGSIGGGTDFGARAIRLCDLPPEVAVSTCPG